VKTENTSVCVTVNCKVCRSAIALYLHVVLSSVYKVSINSIIKSNTPYVITHPQTRDNILHYFL
jgi:hypothetical protein